MAPPKRKTGGGRVTPKGTRPGGHPTKSTHAETKSSGEGSDDSAFSSRSTAPAGRQFGDSKPWAPYVGLGSLGVGVGAIVVYNLLSDKPVLLLVGALAAIIVGMYALTKW